MPASSARLQRKPRPAVRFTARKYRRAYPYLHTEFEGRCVYSDQHEESAGGSRAMDVDHYDPRKKVEPDQDYYNLLLATTHCNSAKGVFWPTDAQARAGIRILNPCEEADYGLHIFEDPKTHKLWGNTPTGKWQIRKLDLNAHHLVRDRELRSALDAHLNSQPIQAKGFDMRALEPIEILRRKLARCIRPIALREPPSDYEWI